MRHHTTTLFAGILLSIVSFGQSLPQVKVLFLGNSFTYFQSMPENFQALAVAAGKSVLIDEYTEDGAVFADDQQGPGYANFNAYPQVLAKIKAQQWDYVVLQDNQGWFCANTVANKDRDANMKLRDTIKAYSPCATIIWFAGWGPKSGCYTGEGAEKAINRIDTNYQWLNNLYPAKKEIVAPLGKAWVSCMKSNPSINLYNTGDNTHPNREGQFLNASVFYSTIFRDDPSNVNFSGTLNGTVSASNAAILRNIAWKTVTTTHIYNSHALGDITPAVTNSGGLLTAASGYSTYQWYLNGMAIAGATSQSYTPTAPGNFQVLATKSNCDNYWSFVVTVTATGVEENTAHSSVSAYPNPVTDVSVIDLQNIHWQGALLEIRNAMGQLVYSQLAEADKIHIDCESLGQGVYLYTVIERSGKKYSGQLNVL